MASFVVAGSFLLLGSLTMATLPHYWSCTDPPPPHGFRSHQEQKKVAPPDSNHTTAEVGEVKFRWQDVFEDFISTSCVALRVCTSQLKWCPGGNVPKRRRGLRKRCRRSQVSGETLESLHILVAEISWCDQKMIQLRTFKFHLIVISLHPPKLCSLNAAQTIITVLFEHFTSQHIYRWAETKFHVTTERRFHTNLHRTDSQGLNLNIFVKKFSLFVFNNFTFQTAVDGKSLRRWSKLDSTVCF